MLETLVIRQLFPPTQLVQIMLSVMTTSTCLNKCCSSLFISLLTYFVKVNYLSFKILNIMKLYVELMKFKKEKDMSSNG